MKTVNWKDVPTSTNDVGGVPCAYRVVRLAADVARPSANKSSDIPSDYGAVPETRHRQ